MKTIIVACGAGVATSTIITSSIEKLLQEKNIKYRIIQCSLREVKSYEDQGNLIVSSMPLQGNYNIPVVLGLSFITGMGIDETKNKILSYLNKEG
jgi:PTS system galactitol-specific IIB component